MPIWFTLEEERPDVGTVIFKADDYYERLQHITGVWNENRFLYYDITRSSRGHYRFAKDEEESSKIFQVSDIENVPMLLAYLEKANMKGVLPAAMIDFMYDLHRLYVNKMCEYGYSTRRMSKKEYDLIENHEKWTRLVKAMDELRLCNMKEASDAKKRKRKLLPVIQHTYTRIENLPTRQKNPPQKTEKKDNGPRRSSQLGAGGVAAIQLDKYSKMLRMKSSKVRKFFFKSDYENPYAWDFGKTRLYDRKHVQNAGNHIEFTRFYHKIAKALRFSRSEPVDWRTISLEEVDKHRYLSDCWMIIKGRVYDVTSYLKAHPGGSGLIMQGAGIDATEVFVSVHPYVVFYKHLPRLQIGTVENFQEHERTEWEPPAYFDIFRILKEWTTKPTHPLAKYKPKTNFEQYGTYYVYSVTFPSSLSSTQSDWTVTIRNGFQITVIKFIEPPFVWYGGFDLKTSVMDDTVYRWFSDDFNTLELKIAKSYKVRVHKPIKDWRQDHSFFLSSYSLKDKFKASVVERTRIADGVKLYGICVGLNKFIGCPLGCYVNLHILDETRPYAPVCLPDEFEKRYVDDSGEFQTLYFIIKEFKDGAFTSMLHYLPIKKILKDVDLYVSPPMGNFSSNFLFENMDMMLLIAGGTGISVMTRIIQEYLHNKAKIIENTSIILFFFVQHREDLIWKDKWMELNRKYKWFHFFYSLTRVYRFAVDKDEEIEDGTDSARGSVRSDGTDKRGTDASQNKSGQNNTPGSKTVKVSDLKSGKTTTKENKDKPLSESVTRKGSKTEKRTSSKKTKKDPRLLEFDSTRPQELYGYPSKGKLKFIFDVIKGAYDTQCHKALVCGPFGFNHSCEQMLKAFGMHKEENIYYFAG